MELPAVLVLLICVVFALSALVSVAMGRQRDHALRDRFAEEQERDWRDYRDDRRR